MDRARSPLARVRGITTAAVSVAVRWPLAIVEIAAVPGLALARVAIETALGFALPPANAAAGGAPAALWSGPGRWLLVAERGARAELAAEVERAAAGTAAINDLSDARFAIRIAGPAARELLAKGCAIDLDSPAMHVHRVAATALARLPALLHMVDDRPTLDVYVDRSYAEYLWDWLAEHAAALGAPA
jgi:sarcosine oxidase subunit gamma